MGGSTLARQRLRPAVLAVALAAGGTLGYAQDTSCQVQDFWIVAGGMGRGTGAAALCQTEVTVLAGEMLQICAKGQIELNNTPDVAGAEGRPGTIAGAAFWQPGVAEGQLIGEIDGTAFPIGRCFIGPAPATGTLMLGINDEFYTDNTGSFKVKGLNVVSGIGNIDPANGAALFAIAGASTGVGWVVGTSLAGTGPPGNPNLIGPAGPVAPGLGAPAFVMPFVNAINAMVAPDPDCVCAQAGPAPVTLWFLGGRNNPPLYNLWVNGCNTAAPAPAAGTGFVAGCAFNPTITMIGVAAVPTLQEIGLVALVLLMLGSGAFVLLGARRRRLDA